MPQDTLNILDFSEIAINPEKKLFQHHNNNWMRTIKVIRTTTGVSFSQTPVTRM